MVLVNNPFTPALTSTNNNPDGSQNPHHPIN